MQFRLIITDLSTLNEDVNQGFKSYSNMLNFLKLFDVKKHHTIEIFPYDEKFNYATAVNDKFDAIKDNFDFGFNRSLLQSGCMTDIKYKIKNRLF